MNRREWGALALILSLACALRLFKADTALWYDEIYTVVNFVRLPTSTLIATYDSLNNHMLYSLAAQASVAILGESSLSVRLPAILLGLGSIFVQWRISRRVTGPVQALIVALLLTLSYHHVWFSQNARGYTGLLFFTSAATLAFIKGLENPNWKTWTSYGLLVAAAMYTHLSAGFFFVAHGAAYALFVGQRLLKRNGDELRWPGLMTIKPIYGVAFSIFITLLLYSPIIGQAAHTINAVSTASSSPSGAALAEWRNPLRAVQEIGASIATAGPLVPVILIGVVLVLAVGIYALYRRSPMLTAIYVLHVPLATILLYAAGVRIWPRYYFVDIGFIFMAIVEGVFVWSACLVARSGLAKRWTGGANALAAVGVVAMVLISLILLRPNYTHPKQDYIGARDYVRSRVAPHDAITSIGLAGYAYSHYYAPHMRVVETGADLERVRASAPTTWLLMAFPHQTQAARPDVAAELAAHFDQVATFPGTLGDGAVWVYRSRGTP
ncbi:MAG: glycosyltransferase family 39 protein [Sphingobium sp.]